MYDILEHLVLYGFLLFWHFINDWVTAICIFLHIPELENNLFLFYSTFTPCLSMCTRTSSYQS